MIKPFVFHLPVEPCCVSNNGLGRGIFTLARTACKDRQTPYAEPELRGWEDTALTAPCPTQKLRLQLHKEKAGGRTVQMEEGSKPGMNAIWPLTVRYQISWSGFRLAGDPTPTLWTACFTTATSPLCKTFCYTQDVIPASGIEFGSEVWPGLPWARLS